MPPWAQSAATAPLLKTAIKANKPYLVEVMVDRDIKPVGTGTWSLPPLPHAEPNFLKLARGG